MVLRKRAATVISVLLTATSSSPAKAGILENYTFDGSNPTAGMSFDGCGSTAVNSGKYVSPSKSLRFFLPEEPAKDSCERQEFRVGNDTRNGDRRWYGFAIYVPSNYEDEETINFQTGAPPDPGESQKRGGPPLGISNDGERFELIRQWDTNRITTPETIRGTSYDLGAIRKGQWNYFVINVKWHPSNGFLKVWRDNDPVGKPRVNVTGGTNRNDGGNILFGGGIYDGNHTRQQDLLLHYDNLRMGDENSSHAEVYPDD